MCTRGTFSSKENVSESKKYILLARMVSRCFEIYCNECIVCASERKPSYFSKNRRATGENCNGLISTLTTSAIGNKYILVIVDYFTKWTKAFVLRNHKAGTIAKKFVEEYICRLML